MQVRLIVNSRSAVSPVFTLSAKHRKEFLAVLFSSLFYSHPITKKKINHLLLPQTPAEGASITVYAAAASEMEGVGGCYLYNGQKRESAESSYDAELQAKLWKTSCELVDVKSSWVPPPHWPHTQPLPNFPLSKHIYNLHLTRCAKWVAVMPKALWNPMTYFPSAPLWHQSGDYIDPILLIAIARRMERWRFCLFVCFKNNMCTVIIYLV